MAAGRHGPYAPTHIDPSESPITGPIAQFLVVLFGLWLLAVGALMLMRPETARGALAAMASTPTIHFGEHAARFLVGLAFVFAASRSKAPQAFLVFGGFMAVTSALIVMAPRRWHVRYAEFWAARLEPWMFRALSPVSFLGGALVIWAAT